MADVNKKDKRIHVLADSIKGLVTIADDKHNFAEGTAEALITAFNDNNGDDKPKLSQELLKEVDTFYKETESALVYATGIPGIDHFKGNAEANVLKGSLTLGTTEFMTMQNRSTFFPNPQYDAEKNPDVPQKLEQFGRVTVKRSMEKGGAAYGRAIKAVLDYGTGDVL